MKKDIIIILLLLPFAASSQLRYDTTVSIIGGIYGFNPSYKIVSSKYDTTVIYKGGDCNRHNWVKEKIQVSFWGCGVYHDAAGCPDGWLNQKSICTNCLKHIQVKETREVQVVKDPYEEALERLNKLKTK